MKIISIFLCSPRKNGTTDTLAGIWAKTAETASLAVRHIALRDYGILPCAGCNACFSAPYACILRNNDNTEELFALLFDSTLVVFATPIYFYALPAHFKAFIDRGQRFWGARAQTHAASPARPALTLMAAGRPRGEKLFSGALRTLRWFGHALNLDFTETLTFRGLDQPTDLDSHPEIIATLEESAKNWSLKLRK